MSPLQLLNNYWSSQKHCTCDHIYNVLGTPIPSPDAQKSPTESWRLIKAEKIKQVDENGPAIAAALHPENLPAPHGWYGCVCVINAFLTTWCTDVPSTQAQFTYCHHFWEGRAVTQHMLGLLRSSLCIRPHMWTEAGDDIASSHRSIITCFLFPTCQIWYFGIVIYPFCFPLFLNFHPYPECQNLNQRNCHEAILLASYKSSHCSRWLLLKWKGGGLYLSTHQIFSIYVSEPLPSQPFSVCFVLFCFDLNVLNTVTTQSFFIFLQWCKLQLLAMGQRSSSQRFA